MAKKKNTAATTASDMTYSAAVTRLQEILAQVESPECDLDALTTLLPEAQRLLGQCKERLMAVELQLKQD